MPDAVLEVPVAVPQADRAYVVRVAPGSIADIGVQVRRSCPRASSLCLVSDDNVMPLHGALVATRLRESGFEVLEHVVPAGEASKTSDRLLELVDAMIVGGLSRNDAVVAVGGGVVGDLAGFAAATFMRGIDFVQCPTSLLAQVDASVGGKVAIDIPAGKNLMGAFHFPRAVIVDPEVLVTLPDVELACGLAEMLKHGALFSREHFDDVVGSADLVYARDRGVLTRLIAASVSYKATCVARDPRESDAGAAGRIVLNLGHTVGHAIEHVSEFGTRHGEAVALGLVAAARLSEQRGLVVGNGPESTAGGLESRMIAALERLRLPVDLDTWLGDDRREPIEAALAADKKRSSTHLSYIGLAELGAPVVVPLTASEIVALLRAPSGDC